MAGPQFSSPPSVVPSKPKRRFTLQQANQALPLVSRIVRDIVATHAEAVTMQSAIDRRMEKGNSRRGEDKELETKLDRLQEYIEELTEIGVELKDCQTGLIDFIGRHKGHDVCLCWKLGETSVAYWHELDSGFAGRQPAAMLEETA